MKTTKTGWAQKGFTIVEIMIFLAVSGFMFILAAVFINGKQDNVAYHQGVQATNSTLVGTINSVANGEYSPLPDGYYCQSGLTGAPTFGPKVTSMAQGTSLGCIFMGKVIQFGYNQAKAVSDSTSYSTYTVVGRQFSQGTDPSSQIPVKSFSDAAPITALDLTDTSTLQQGLTYSNGFLCEDAACSSPQPISGVGFFGTFGNYIGGQVSGNASGSQSVTVVTMPTTNDMASSINADLPSAKTDAPANSNIPDVLTSGSYVVLCFAYGNKQASVTIGGPGGQLTDTVINFGKQGPC